MALLHTPTFLSWLCLHSMAGAVVVGLVLVVRGLVFRGRAARWRGALWTVVFARLLIPVLPASRFSALNAMDWLDAARVRFLKTSMTPSLSTEGSVLGGEGEQFVEAEEDTKN